VEINNLAVLHTASNTSKSKHVFPWDRFPENESTSFEIADLFVASNVEVGAAKAKTVIAKKLTVGMGSVKKAFVFDAFEIGVGGFIEHLVCSQATAAVVNLGSVFEQKVVSNDDLVEFALKEISLND